MREFYITVNVFAAFLSTLNLSHRIKLKKKIVDFKYPISRLQDEFLMHEMVVSIVWAFAVGFNTIFPVIEYCCASIDFNIFPLPHHSTYTRFGCS